MMRLETKRLIIREFTMTDMADVHRYASDPAVTEHTMWGPNAEEDTLQYLRMVIQYSEQTPRNNYELAITLKDGGVLIGGCGIYRMDTNAEIGYCLNRDYWRQGYASEAAEAICRFGFETLGVHRIYATCRPGNVGSAGVLRRIGMTQEGHLREHLWFKEQFHDSYLFSILKDEFARSHKEQWSDKR